LLVSSIWLQAAIDGDMAGRVTGASQSCIPWQSTQSLHATDSGELIYRAADTI
jgi:hypothetical protein